VAHARTGQQKVEPTLQMTFRFSTLVLILTVCTVTWAQKGQKGKYTEINEALKKPKDVIELQLSGISEPLPALDKFVNLKIARLINLSSEYDLKDAFEKLSKTNVDELYLYGNTHKELPQNIANLTNLKKVELNFSLSGKLEKTLVTLSKIQNIEYIGLRGFRLIFLPNELTNFKKLKSINLGDNPSLNYDQVFELLSQIETIESLNLDYNYFNGIPESILKLKNLKRLELSMLSGKFNTPETYQILSKLDRLEHLDISGNFFGEFPEEIALLNELKVLNIDGNGVTGEDFEKLKRQLPKTKIINDIPY
jgi:hypothetical protein